MPCKMYRTALLECWNAFGEEVGTVGALEQVAGHCPWFVVVRSTTFQQGFSSESARLCLLNILSPQVKHTPHNTSFFHT